MTIRRFKLAEGRHLTMPADLMVGPGVTTMRLVPGDVFDLDAEVCQAQQRFISGRLRAGDLVELEVKGDRAVVVREPVAPSAPPVMELPELRGTK